MDPGDGGEVVKEALGVASFIVVSSPVKALAELVVKWEGGERERLVMVVGEGCGRGKTIDFGDEVFDDGGKIEGGAT